MIGKYAILPLVGRRIPIIADAYADPELGSGAVKITPAHDFNDFEVGRHHDLPLVNILDREAKLNLDNNKAFLEGLWSSPELTETLALHGIDRFVLTSALLQNTTEIFPLGARFHSVDCVISKHVWVFLIDDIKIIRRTDEHLGHTKEW